MVRALYFYEFLDKASSDSALSSGLCFFSGIINQSNRDLVMATRKKVISKDAFSVVLLANLIAFFKW